MATNEKSIRVKDDGSITAGGKTYKNKAAYKSRNTKKNTSNFFSKDSIEKRKEKNKQKVKEYHKKRYPNAKVYAKESMFSKAREDSRKNTAKARPFGVAFKSAKDAGKKTFLWKGKSYHTKTKSELEAGKSEKAKFETKARANKMPGRQSVFSKFKSSKTGAEFVRKLKQK